MPRYLALKYKIRFHRRHSTCSFYEHEKCISHLATTWKNWLHPQYIFPKLSNGLCFTHFLTVSVIPTAFAAFTATLFPCTKLFFNMVCLDVSLCAQPFSLATTFCGLLCSCRAVTATAGQLSSKMSPSELHKTYHDDDNTIFLYTLSDLMFYVIV